MPPSCAGSSKAGASSGSRQALPAPGALALLGLAGLDYSGLMSEIGRATPWCIISAFRYSPLTSFCLSRESSLIGLGYGKFAFFWGTRFR